MLCLKCLARKPKTKTAMLAQASGSCSISDQEMATNSIFQFSLELPEPIEGTNRIDLGVDCLWSRSAENVNRHWSGYQIIDASPEALEAIDALIGGYAS